MFYLKKYPVVIFCYNRPYYLEQLIKSLKKNKYYKSFKYYFFCDGPKKIANDVTNCRAVSEIIKNFKVKKKIINRKKNIGLSNNVISGLNLIFKKKKYEGAIILEDDLELNKNCLIFLSSALNYYKNYNDIGSITGYSYIDKYKKFLDKDYFLSFRHCSWCWGTWSKIWNKIEWSNYKLNKGQQISDFSIGGKDLPLMLKAQEMKLVNSWAIRFNFYCFKKKLLSIAPRFSHVINNGFRSSATHLSIRSFFQTKKLKDRNIKKFGRPFENQYIHNYIRYTNFISIRLLVKVYIRKFFN